MGNVYSYATLVDDVEDKCIETEADKVETDVELAQKEIEVLKAQILETQEELKKWKTCAYNRSFPELETEAGESVRSDPEPELKWTSVY